MVSVQLEKTIPITTDKVWGLLSDFGNLDWILPAEFVELIGEGPGMTRRIVITGMEPVDEVLEAMDHASQTFSYTIPRGLPFPVTDYRASVAVMDNGDGSTLVRWTSTGQAQGITDAQASEMIEGVYSQMLDTLQTYLMTQ